MSDYVIVKRGDLELARNQALSLAGTTAAKTLERALARTPPAEGREAIKEAYDEAHRNATGRPPSDFRWNNSEAKKNYEAMPAPADTEQPSSLSQFVNMPDADREEAGKRVAERAADRQREALSQLTADAQQQGLYEQPSEAERRKIKLKITSRRNLEPMPIEDEPEPEQPIPLTCSNCGPITSDDTDIVDQTIGCKKCGGVEWGDDGITIEHREQPITAQEARARDTVLQWADWIDDVSEDMYDAKTMAIRAFLRQDRDFLLRYIEQTAQGAAQDREDAERWRHLQLMSKDHVIEIIQGTSIPYRYGGCSFTEEVDKDRKDRQQGKGE